MPNLIQNLSCFQMPSGTHFGRFMAQNGSNMKPKWSQNCPKTLSEDGVGEGVWFRCVLGFIFGQISIDFDTVFAWFFNAVFNRRTLYVCNANVQKYCISAGYPAPIWRFCYTERLSGCSTFLVKNPIWNASQRGPLQEPPADADDPQNVSKNSPKIGPKWVQNQWKVDIGSHPKACSALGGAWRHPK